MEQHAESAAPDDGPNRSHPERVETLGSRLRELRISEPYMKLREAARLLHSDPQWLSKVENDRLKPPPGALVDFAGIYNADITELASLWERWKEAPPPDPSRSICTGRKAHG